MPLGVMQNLAATGVLNQLKNTETVYKRQIERLSSGLRINHGSDDPAGLVISEKYMAQIDGLDQAVKNANDGVNLVQTAEGALDEIASQLRGMRTLALHAANTGPNDASAAAADQNQISSAISTINRIASTTQFGTRKLLDGSSGVSGVATDGGVTFLSGTAATVGGTYDVNVTTAATQGKVESATGLTTGKMTGAVDAGAVTAKDATMTLAGDLVDGDTNGAAGPGVTLALPPPAAQADVVSAINNNATLKARGITASVDTSGGGSKLVISTDSLTAGGGSELTVSYGDGAGPPGGGAELAIATGMTDGDAMAAGPPATSASLVRGETLSFRNSASTSVQVKLASGQSIATAVSQMNQALSSAGIKVEASFDTTSQKIALTNTEYGSKSTVGNVFSSSLAGSNAGSLGLAGAANTQYNIAGSGLSNGTDGADVAGTIGGFAANGAGQILSGLSGTAIEGLQVKVSSAAGAAGTLTVNQSSMTFQVGAFANQTVGLSIADMRANQLGASATGTSDTTTDVNVAGIDVTKGDGDGAQDAIKVLDSALTQVNTLRAGLGSFQKDTLQSTVRNMMVATQNMRTSESQIRDANMAEETLSFSRAQILQQTGIAMLTQANQAPNQLMSLFRGG